MMRSLTITLCLLATVFSACSHKEPGPDVLKTFTVKGVIVRVDDEGRTLVIKHEEMPGYMGAMTMPFRVKDANESAKVTPGDEIRFTYNVAELSSWVENIELTGKKVAMEIPSTKQEPSSPILKVGEPFPDFELLNENGELVKLGDYRGSVVALTFIFTRCPVPEYCPAMMRNFKEVETLLQADAKAPTNYKLLTVSFDSDYDTPEVMKAYGEKFGSNSGNWNLLTSPKSETIRSLGESVGLMFGKSQSSIYSHNLRTVVLDTKGRITKIFTDESWKPEDLVKEIKLTASNN
jgi:protein SCO1